MNTTNHIEVKRARVRTLAWSLMTNRPKDFNLGRCGECSIGHCSSMPEFQIAGVEKKGNQSYWGGEPLLWRPAEFFGLASQYFGMPHSVDDASAVMGRTELYVMRYAYADPFLVGITYLAAIGDCGPPEKARAARLMPVVIERVEA